MTRVGIIAGEASGDVLGASLMQALGTRLPEVSFCGVGGERMLAAGLDPLLPLERFAMNGFAEPVKRLPGLVGAFRHLLDHYARWCPDVFIGVDFNVFNSLVERIMHRRGIRVAHYVSPSVYAWRPGRARRLAGYTDLLLTLFPFEAAYYRGLPLAVHHVGHPLADELAAAPCAAQARKALGLASGPVYALLPGSRRSELELLFDDFMGAAELLVAAEPAATVLIAAASPVLRAELDRRLAEHDPARYRLVDGARLAIAASDGVLVKSGTGTLETMLIGRPMVVAYRLGPLSYQLVKRMLRTPYVALPNILAGEALVPELLQAAVTPEALATALREQMERFERGTLRARFEALGDALRRPGGAGEQAAGAVLELLERGCG